MRKAKWFMLATVAAFAGMAALAAQENIAAKEERLQGTRSAFSRTGGNNDRCVFGKLTKEQCKQRRDQSLRKNCVSHEEYKIMQDKDLFPVCMYYNDYDDARLEPSERLRALCNCNQ